MKKPLPFSNLERSTTLSSLKNTRYDLIVIGGGITGAGILLDAASRGLKALLLEKGDFASGTSSKSTKLIHGGLRYLKQFDFWLVHEVGSERAIVHKLAPHLVLPEKMLLPLIENGSYGKWLTSIGLKVYDILAQVGGEDKRQMLEKEEALAIEPLLPQKILNGAGYYAEYRTDDARLTTEVIKTSLHFGAEAFNYAEVKDFLYEKKKVSGVIVSEHLTGEEINLEASYVINAAGPWVDSLRAINKSKKGKQLHLSKGVHLVFPFRKLPVKQSIYFDVPDGRMMFAIPRGKVTYVGTTDTNYNEDKDDVNTNLADAMYLITAVNNMFPSVDLGLEDIQSSWAGLRPLIHEEGKSASELSRKDEIFISKSGLISIAGGKLTGYRKMAERAVDKLLSLMPDEEQAGLKKCHTDAIPLVGSDFKNFEQVENYITAIEERVKKEGLADYNAWYLVTTYGKQSEQILDIYDSLENGEAQERLMRAEVRFTIQFERVSTAMDFFIRRTGRLYFDIEQMQDYLDAVLDEFGSFAGVSEKELVKWKKKLLLEIKRHSEFTPDRA
ncbi:MAG: glycerol-3-phosphate dehydrogenase/oxidase [Flavobacteriaceae bacterium]|nr:glycerol-3-phosphate dehydrogenase/oxidase [Flavobacteriaceae bacterium]MDH3795903.1 glycerol-3-phosphate dehydrogenase/oxidase [Flavobacteriaceae bacterium]